MEKNRKGLLIAVIALVVAIAGTGIAFAAMSTTLNISGTAEMDPASWEIKFQNLGAVVLTGDASVTTPPTLSDTSIGTFAVVLTKPGDSVSYTFEVKNNGSLGASLSTLTKAATPTCTGTGATATADATLVCTTLTYTLTYTADSTPVAAGAGNGLTAGQARGMTLKIEYPSTATAVPADTVQITNLGITLIYEQS